MKTIFPLVLSLVCCLALTGQSALLTMGGTYRNSNHLSRTGNQKVGWQLGYQQPVAAGWALGVNLGSVSNHWEVNRSSVLVFREEERNTYLEAVLLFPLLRRAAADKLKLGLGYVGSYNRFDYAEMAVISNRELTALNANSLSYYLHELGLMLSYAYPLTDHFTVYGSTNFSASINRVPAYQSTIVTSGGGGSSLSSTEERHVFHYRFSAGIGYQF